MDGSHRQRKAPSPPEHKLKTGSGERNTKETQPPALFNSHSRSTYVNGHRDGGKADRQAHKGKHKGAREPHNTILTKHVDIGRGDKAHESEKTKSIGTSDGHVAPPPFSLTPRPNRIKHGTQHDQTLIATRAQTMKSHSTMMTSEATKRADVIRPASSHSCHGPVYTSPVHRTDSQPRG